MVALVNGQPITRLALIQELEKQGGKSVLESLVSETLIFQEAGKQKIKVTDQEVEKALAQLEENLKGQGQDLNELLQLQGISKDDLRKQLKLKTLVEKILGKDISVTDKEVSDFLKENKSTFPKDVKPEEASASAREQLVRQKIGGKTTPWLESLRTSAKIQYLY